MDNILKNLSLCPTDRENLGYLANPFSYAVGGLQQNWKIYAPNGLLIHINLCEYFYLFYRKNFTGYLAPELLDNVLSSYPFSLNMMTPNAFAVIPWKWEVARSHCNQTIKYPWVKTLCDTKHLKNEIRRKKNKIPKIVIDLTQ